MLPGKCLFDLDLDLDYNYDYDYNLNLDYNYDYNNNLMGAGNDLIKCLTPYIKN